MKTYLLILTASSFCSCNLYYTSSKRVIKLKNRKYSLLPTSIHRTWKQEICSIPTLTSVSSFNQWYFCTNVMIRNTTTYHLPSVWRNYLCRQKHFGFILIVYHFCWSSGCISLHVASCQAHKRLTCKPQTPSVT